MPGASRAGADEASARLLADSSSTSKEENGGRGVVDGDHHPGGGSSPRPAAAPAGPVPRLGAFGLAVVSFAAIAGGPYGIEASVGAGGALPTLLGLAAAAVCWSATQALVTAELATMLPSNAGYVAWVTKGLGPVAGFVNAWNMLLSASFNIPLYPVLFSQYVAQLSPGIGQGALWGVKLTGLVIVTLLNVVGVEAVQIASLVMVLLVQTPFLLMPITAAALGQTFDWGAVASSGDWLGNFPVFISTICWNMQGWVTLGNVAAEVKDPRTSYPLGLSVSAVLVALNYLYPVALTVPLAPDTDDWDTGYFVQIAANTAPWLGYWALVAGGLSCMANFVPQMTVAARALRAAAMYDIVPIPVLRRNMTRWNTPVPAILLQAALVAVLMAFSFDTLVVVQILFANIGLLLQFAAFVRLKYTHPDDALRPFAVPGGKLGAWVVTLPFAALLGMVFWSTLGGTQTSYELGAVAGVNVVLVGGGLAWRRWGFRPEVLEEEMGQVAGRGEDKGAADGGDGDEGTGRRGGE
jgi:amino acid transporter